MKHVAEELAITETGRVHTAQDRRAASNSGRAEAGVAAAVLAQATGHLTKRLADTTDHDVVVTEILTAATATTEGA